MVGGEGDTGKPMIPKMPNPKERWWWCPCPFLMAWDFPGNLVVAKLSDKGANASQQAKPTLHPMDRIFCMDNSCAGMGLFETEIRHTPLVLV